jgi:hypothetical protein
MSGGAPLESEAAPQVCAFYRQAVMALQAAQVPFLVGGGYALAHYAGILRHTKDLDTLSTRTTVPTLWRSSILQGMTRS